MRAPSPNGRALEIACRVTILGAALALLPSLLVPLGFSAEGDALDYRVPLLRWMLRHHAYPSWSWTFVDDYPMLGDLLMLPLAAVKTELARLVAMAAYFAIAWFSAAIGEELAGGRDRARFLFLFASALGLHTILVQAGHVMVDNLASAAALACLYFVLRGRLPLAGACLGFALGTRYMIWGAAPGAALALLRLRAGRPRTLAVFAALAALGPLPCLVRNAIVNHNPFFPLLNDLFLGEPLHTFDGWGRGKGPLALLLFPYDLLVTNSFRWELFDTRSFTGGAYVYKLGALFYAQLAALTGALALRGPSAAGALRAAARDAKVQAAALFWLCLFLFWFFGSQQLRFFGGGIALLNLCLTVPLYSRLPRPALAGLALLALVSVGYAQAEAWRVWLGREESFRQSAYVQSAERCFARAGVTSASLVGFFDRNALLGYFDFDFVFLPGTNLFLQPRGAPPPPSPDFIYSGFVLAPRDGFELWPKEKPCLLKRL